MLAFGLAASARAQPSPGADASPSEAGAKPAAPMATPTGAQPAGKATPALAKAPAKPAKPSGDPRAVSEVVVTAKTPDVVKSIDRRSYAVDKDLHAASGSIADVLRNLPSVQVDTEGNVSLRGDPGVTILIDGRPSALMSGDARGTTLLQLPASEFERVEVMTNPSAAFSPEGSAGIINLIRRKTHKPGVNAAVTVNLGEDGRENGSVHAAYSSAKLGVRAGVGLRRSFSPLTTDTTRDELDPVWGPLAVGQQVQGSTINKSLNASLGGDYNPDAKSRFSADLSYFRFDGLQNQQEDYVADSAASLPVESYETRLASEGRGSFSDQSLSYLRKFAGDGHQLTIDLSHNSLSVLSLAQSRYADVLGVSLDPFQTRSARTANAETELKAEYQRPLGRRATTTLGLSLDLTSDSSDHDLASGASASDEVVQPGFSDRFSFHRRVFAAYGTLQREFGHLTVLGGLRFEDSHDRIQSLTSGTTGQGADAALFPSLHLSYDLSRDQQLTASYSRRVHRPSGGILDPFRVSVGPNNYTQGDPHLGPAFTDSFEVGYDIHHKAADYQATLFYRSTTGLPDLVYSDLGGGAILTSYEPLGSRRDGGLELNVTNKLTRTLSLSLNATGSWNQIGDPSLDAAARRSALTYFANGSINWDVTPKDLVQLEGFFRGRTLLPQGYAPPGGNLNLGYRHTFNQRLTLVVTADKLLGANRADTVLDTPTLKEISRSRSGERMVFLGLTYSFGSGKRAAGQGAKFDFSDGSAGGGR